MNVVAPFFHVFVKPVIKPSFFILTIFMLIITGLPAESTVVDRIVAVINDDIITLKEMNALAGPYEDIIRSKNLSQDREIATIKKMKDELLDNMIYEILARQEAARVGIKIPKDAVDKAIDYIKNSKGLDHEGLVKEVEKDGMSYEKFRQNIEFQILKPQLINKIVKSKIVVTDNEVKQYYIDNDEKYAGEIKYHLRNIILRVTSYSTDEEKDEIKAKMEMIREKMKKGDSFSDLAMTYSQSPQSSDGGDLGFFKYSELSPFLKDELRGKGPGFTTSIFLSEQGFQIFYVEEKIDGNRISLEDVSDDIFKLLSDKKMEEKYNSWVSDVKEKSYIKIID